MSWASEPGIFSHSHLKNHHFLCNLSLNEYNADLRHIIIYLLFPEIDKKIYTTSDSLKSDT